LTRDAAADLVEVEEVEVEEVEELVLVFLPPEEEEPVLGVVVGELPPVPVEDEPESLEEPEVRAE